MPREADVTGSGKRTDPASGLTDEVLRAKYLDYCSARVTEALLRLSPDEMYLLAQSSEGDPRPEGAPSPEYSEIVRLATGRISSRLSLPDFATWVEEYRRDPQRIENELLGLWATDSPAPAGNDS